MFTCHWIQTQNLKMTNILLWDIDGQWIDYSACWEEENGFYIVGPGCHCGVFIWHEGPALKWKSDFVP